MTIAEPLGTYFPSAPIVSGYVPTAPPKPVFRPPTPEHPSRVVCRHCDKWMDLGPDPDARLAEMWQLWVQVQQELLEQQWRQSDAVRRAAAVEALQAAERSAEEREERERASRRQVQADRLFAELVSWGLSLDEARERVSARFPDF